MQTGIYIFEATAALAWIASLLWVFFDCRKSNENRTIWGVVTFIFGPLGLISYMVKKRCRGRDCQASLPQ